MDNKNKVHPMLILLAVLLSISLILNACVAPRVKATDTPSQTEVANVKNFLISSITANANGAIAISNLLADGNISASDQEALAVFGLQNASALGICQAFGIDASILQMSHETAVAIINGINWDNMDWTTVDNTIASGSSGVYQITGDNQYYTCSMYARNNNPAVLVQSAHFELVAEFSSSPNSFYEPDNFGTFENYEYVNSNGTKNIGIQFTKGDYGSRYYYISKYDTQGFFASSMYNRYATAVITVSFLTGTSVPVFTSGQAIPNTICGNAVYYDTPTGQIDKLHPWNYWNNSVNPYIQQNYPNGNDYMFFPDGYLPDNGGGGTNNNIDIPVFSPILTPIDVNGVAVIGAAAGAVIMGGINITMPINGIVEIGGTPFELPIDDLGIDGHTIDFPDSTHFTFDDIPVTINPDGSLTIDGTTYQFPIGQYETYPVENNQYVYTVEMPTMETIEVNQVSFNAPDLSSISDGVAWWWAVTHTILDDSGILSILPILFGLGLLGFALYKLGG